MMKVIQTGWAGWEICNQVFAGFGSELSLAMPGLRPPRYSYFPYELYSCYPFTLTTYLLKLSLKGTQPNPHQVTRPLIPA